MRVFFDDTQNRHDPKSYYTRGQMRAPQELPKRTPALIQGVERANLAVEQPADFGMAPISAIHDLGYLRFLESAHRRWTAGPEDWGDEVMSNVFVRSPNPLRGILAEAGRYQADGSSPIGPGTWQAAYASAQTAIAAADVVGKGAQYAYGLCRPPGHHARRDGAGGFCYLNNAAIAAERLRDSGYKRVAVLDPDMHHGQGIQEIFYDRADILYVSIHADPTNFYPVVTGFEDERGVADGHGSNINLPMPHGSEASVFFNHLQEALTAVQLFDADALVLPLGYDIYKGDPQSKVAIDSDGFTQIGKQIRGLGLPTVVIQEGGYDVDNLTINSTNFIGGLLQTA